MPALNILCVKLVRWTGWLLLPVVLAFFATGYAISGRYGFGALAGALAGQGLILLATLVLAAGVGAQFPLAGAAGPGASPARLFSADLVGAALGALLVSSLLVPLLGVTAVCLATAVLNGAAAALAWAKRPCRP